MVQDCFSLGDYSYFDRNCAYPGIDIVTRIYDVQKKASCSGFAARSFFALLIIDLNKVLRNRPVVS